MTTNSPNTNALTEPSTNPLVDELLRVHDLVRHDLQVCQDLAAAARRGAEVGEMRGALDQLAERSPHLRLGVDCLSFCALVHSHHHGEDETLFPVVRRTAPALAPVVDRLEAEHRQVAALLTRVELALDALDASDASDDAVAHDEVVDALDALADHLLTHLTYEEESLRPFLLSLDSWPTDERNDR